MPYFLPYFRLGLVSAGTNRCGQRGSVVWVSVVLPAASWMMTVRAAIAKIQDRMK
jgi:hypothetical protein